MKRNISTDTMFHLFHRFSVSATEQRTRQRLKPQIGNDSSQRLKVRVQNARQDKFLASLVFYLSPLLGSNPFASISELMPGDPRFLLLSAPAETGSYNYVDDEVLCELIEQGARGAYWDIIRRSQRD